MIYEWQCKECGLQVEVKRDLKDYQTPPQVGERGPEHDMCQGYCEPTWERVISLTSTPFQSLRQGGVFADDNGNFAPRKL